MESSILHGALVVFPIVAVPNLAGEVTGPGTTDLPCPSSEWEEAVFSDLFPIDTGSDLADCAVPVWPIASVPMAPVSAMVGVVLSGSPNVDSDQFAWPDAGLRVVRVKDPLPEMVDSAPGNMVADAMLVETAINPMADTVVQFSLSATGAFRAKGEVGSRPVSGSVEEDPPEGGTILQPRLPDGLGNPAKVSAATGDLADWPAERIKVPSPQGQESGTFFAAKGLETTSKIEGPKGQPSGVDSAMTLPPEDRVEDSQAVSRPAEMPDTLPALLGAFPGVMAPFGSDTPIAPSPEIPDVAASTDDPQVAVKVADLIPQIDEPKWPILHPTALILRYEGGSPGNWSVSEVKPGQNFAIPIVRAELARPANSRIAAEPISLPSQSAFLDSQSVDGPNFEQGLLASAQIVSYGNGFAATPLDTGRITAPNLPRLADGIAAALAHGRDGSATLTLSPEELGGVRVSFQPDNQAPDRLVVMLSFDRPETMDLFRRHTDQLADALRAAGYSGVQIGFGGPGGDQTRQNAPHKSTLDSGPEDPIPATVDLSAPTSRRLAGLGALDLRL